MAKPDDDVNGLLADLERTGIMKRRAFSAPYWTAAERKLVLAQIGALTATFEKKAMSMKAPDDAGARAPRRRVARVNGTTNGTAARRS